MTHLSKLVLTFIFLLTGISTSLSQEPSKRDLIKSVQEADISYYYDEDYEKAASLYEPLVVEYPENKNLAAKLGICCLNIDGREKEALSLLERASTNVVENEKDYTEYGEASPLDTWLYLAVAYQRNDSLEKALSEFYNAKKRLEETDVFRLDYIDNQIRDCRYAIEQKKKPLTIILNLFAPWLSEYPGACNPVLAKNDSVFIFTQKTGEKTRILCSYKNGSWLPPKDITKQLGGYDRFYSNSITDDGRLLVLYMDDGGDGNIYFCQRKDSVWSKIKNPGKPINTIYWESHGFITPDGNTIYLASNRPGGVGDLDIWKAEKKEDGTWDNPVNCGEIINTPFNEDTPFFDPASNALLFSSSGHISMGGYDVFRSIFRNGGWTNPVGMPFAFNTTDENTFFILNNNAPGFVASRFDERVQSRNIYSLVAIDPADEITRVEGALTLGDGLTPVPEKASIMLSDVSKKNPRRPIALNTDGTYKFEIKPGDYEIVASHTGYKSETIRLNLPLYFLSHYMVVNAALTPDKVAEGSFLTIKNVLFEFDSYEIDDQAKSILETVKSILTSHPEVKIEIAGYTDSKGSREYNLKLADKRAQAVIDYLTSPAVPSSRFVKKAFGESNFAAVNVNRDGSDNPEGRKYNRRVTFGIVDTHAGVVIRQETYTPEHLRLVSSIKYSIILKKSAEKLQPEYFNNLELDSKLFIRTVPLDSLYVYAVGLFYNKPDAIRYLSYAKGKGYLDAYIINHYDLNKVTKEAARLMPVVSGARSGKIYTIQVKASRNALNMRLFRDFKDIREIYSEDGYYRYVTGEYTQLSQAKEAIKPIMDAGFSDAFIRELNLLIIK
ncbi:MAG: OmpA family protein [Bacteroidales bacterium]|jgi:outer membrane protein OmpA-like peptidoglycan-associated protein|nr:OmpA family protein [Bacteroidales bacterium]